MSYKIIRDASNRHQTGREIVAILDTDEDLAALGNAYAPGSQAIVTRQGGNTYMMNASGEWVKFDDGGSTSGGGSEKVVKWIVPETEVEFADIGNGYAHFENAFPNRLCFGEKYIVNVNGKEYTGYGHLREGGIVELFPSYDNTVYFDGFELDYLPGMHTEDGNGLFRCAILTEAGTYTFSVRQEMERSPKSNIIGALSLAFDDSNRLFDGALIDTDFNTIYKALESGFVGYLVVRDYRACAEMGLDFTDIGTIVNYTADSIIVVYGYGAAVIKSDGTIEIQ